MARIWTEGCEMQDIPGMTVNNFGAGGSGISTVYYRSGVAGIVSGAWGGGNAYTNLLMPVDCTDIYLRFGFYYIGYSSFAQIQWRHGTTVLGGLLLRPFEVPQLQVNVTTVKSGTTVIRQAQWYLIELHINIADAGTFELKIDGQPVEATYSGDTKPGADTHFDNLHFYSTANGYYACDDFAIDNADWVGDGHITRVTPDGTVTNQLTGSDGNTTDNHLLVDEYPLDSDTTYVQGTVVDEEDLYDLTACGLGTAEITRIFAESRTKDTVAAGGTCALITKASGGSEVSGGDVSLLTTYVKRILSAEELLNPVDSQVWEAADIDALQVGVRTRS